jgi:hypothetical protein
MYDRLFGNVGLESLRAERPVEKITIGERHAPLRVGFVRDGLSAMTVKVPIVHVSDGAIDAIERQCNRPHHNSRLRESASNQATDAQCAYRKVRLAAPIIR